MKGGKSKAEPKKTDSRLAVKKDKGGAGTEKAKAVAKKKGAAVKDPNKPKRPPSAFFVFMEDFRKIYKEKHPNNKSVATVGKAGGEKWKSMSDSEKAPYISKAERRKAEYNKSIDTYNKKLAGGAGDEDESDKSKSEVNDEDEDDEDDQSGEEDDDGGSEDD